MLDGGTMPLLSALMLLPKAYSQKLPKKLPIYATPNEKCSKYLAKPILINRLRAIWPKGYQRGSPRKSHQNGDYLKACNAKNCSPAGIEPAAFGLPVHCSTT